MQESRIFPRDFQEVAPADYDKVLSSTGNRGSIRLFLDDKIVVGSTVATREFKPKNGDKAVVVPFVDGSINGVKRPIPFSLFRRFPRNPDQLLNEAPLMKSLYNCPSDYDRFELVKGRTLKVAKIVEGEAIDFAKTTDFSNAVYRTATFPVLAYADNQ